VGRSRSISFFSRIRSRTAYHCIKKMKIDCYNSAWPARCTPNSPTRYYMKVRPRVDEITHSATTHYTDNLGDRGGGAGVGLKQ
jgi:hypothetical protein